MRRHAPLAILLALFLLAAPASAAALPRAISLDRGWTFQLAGGEPHPVSIPHVMQPDPTPQSFSGTTGTYRLRFQGPATPAGFAWGLRFDAVRRVGRVFLNGKLIGVHQDPYVPFTIPAAGLRPGQPNDLVVEVDNRKGPEPREGWWNWGGITRPVSLVPLGPVGLQDLGLMPQVTCPAGGACRDGQFLFDGTLVNRTPTPVRPWVDVVLRAPDGRVAGRAQMAGPVLAPGASAQLDARIHLSGPLSLWAPGHPSRYTASITTSAGPTVAQQDTMKVGLRQVVVRNGHLLLNGERLALRGASIQEDEPGRGPALTDADMNQMVDELKALHANVTRAHYLLNDRLLDKFDAAGILVWTQAPIFHRDVLLRSPGGRAKALATLHDTIIAARSHPSTLVFSVANELNAVPSSRPTTQAYLYAAAKEARRLAPTTPVAVDVLAYPSLPFDPTYRAFDALGINSYFGWYPGKPTRPTGTVAELPHYMQVWKDRYRNQALVLTEFGAEATENGPATEKQTYAFQSAYVRSMLDAVAKSPADGAIYWTLREFAVKPFWDGMAPVPRPKIATDSIHNKGLITYAGKPKPAWSVAEKMFAATPLFPDAPRITRPVTPPAARIDALGALLVGGALLMLLGLVLLNLRAFRDLRERRDEPEMEPAYAPSSGRELDREDVTVGHDVVAAFEA